MHWNAGTDVSIVAETYLQAEVWMNDEICFVLLSVADVAEVIARIVRYLSGANQVMQLPLAEVILTNKDKG